MDQYIVSARKYRPTTFSSVVGQQAVTSTLKNAIKNNQLAQAFLFCGPRGVGKTTCARILAKAINCTNRTADTEACNECESCRSFNEGQSLNIYELDAASNNSVDDIRELINQVRIAPQLGDKKVYIIDEVHMLSQAAFNAFLKTLEEPPKHAIFILATTEKHKILPTILSRCQVFDFNRIKINDIAQHLSEIAQKESIEADKNALHLIAEKADGALRDALSIFDQLASYSGKNLTYQHAIESLNVLDYDYYFKITEAVFSQDVSTALLIFNEVLSKGFDGNHFINGLAEHFRNLLVCKFKDTITLLEVSDDIKSRYQSQSQAYPDKLLLSALNSCNDADLQYKNAKNKRLLVELTLMKIASLQDVTLIQSEKKNELKLKKENKAQENLPPAAESITDEKALPQKESQAKTLEEEKPKYEVVNKESEVVAQATAQKAESPKEVEPVTKEVPNSVIPGVTLSGKSIFSINEALNKNTEADKSQDNQKDEKELPATPFDQEKLMKVWEAFVEKMNEQNKISLATTLKMHSPEIKNENLIYFPIDNSAQQEDLKSVKTDFIDFLRSRLNNYAVSLEIEITKSDSPQKAYTAKEKFEEMAKENPALLKLKERLKLEIE